LGTNNIVIINGDKRCLKVLLQWVRGRNGHTLNADVVEAFLSIFIPNNAPHAGSEKPNA
jgi:hypothetical protein